MKRFIKVLLTPSTPIIIIYCILSFVGLAFYVWRCSFFGDFIIATNDLILALLILIGISSLISIFVDKKYGSTTRQYLVVSFVQLIIIWAFAAPIRVWQIDSTLQNAAQIVDALEKYKRQSGDLSNYNTSA